MDCPNNKYIDHINHNTLDNRKNNLRIVTNSQNIINSKKSSNFINEDVGVEFDKRSGNWSARIEYKSNRIYLGTFNNKKDAIKSRRKAEIKYFNKYRYDKSIEK